MHFCPRVSGAKLRRGAGSGPWASYAWLTPKAPWRKGWELSAHDIGDAWGALYNRVFAETFFLCARELDGLPKVLTFHGNR